MNELANEKKKPEKIKVGLADMLTNVPQIQRNKYSLEPDLISGWRPNKTTLQAAMPFQYDYGSQEQILTLMMSSYTKMPVTKLAYIGFRPKDSYDLHF